MRRNIVIRLLLLMILLCGSIIENVRAQQLGTWQLYPSYTCATSNLVAGTRVYSLCNGNLLSYDTEDESVRLFNCMDGLNDICVKYMDYSSEAKRVILVYDNGNIDLIDEKQRVVNLSAFKDKPISDKGVNGVYIDGVTAYLLTDFGYIEVDMKEAVVRDTYTLRRAVYGVAIVDDTMYMTTTQGCLYAKLADNRHVESSWHSLCAEPDLRQIVPFDGQLLFCKNNLILRYDGTQLTTCMTGNSNIAFMKVLSDGSLAWADNNNLYINTTLTQRQSLAVGSKVNDVTFSKKVYWLSMGDAGLQAYVLDNNNQLQRAVGPIRPNSPYRDLFYRMSYAPTGNGDYRLLVAGGANTETDTQTEPVAMYMQDERWTLLDESPARTILPGVAQSNTTDLVQDPKDATHFFAGTWRNGLKEYRDDRLIQIYSSDNSTVASILPDNHFYHQYEPATALQYDDEGNLWFFNQHTDTLVRYLTPDGKWKAHYFEAIKGLPFVNASLITSEGNIFVAVMYRTINSGLFVFHRNGNRVDKHNYITSLVNQNSTSYGELVCTSLAEDLTGRVWVGTESGLFVMDSQDEVFDKDYHFTQVIINRNDGSGLGDYLLNGVKIKCIVIDGANRKWVGTEDNGVYLISADGTEMLQHFMSEDSPLLSNNINSLAVNPQTGLLMIGTDKGLCSYMSDATEASESLSDNSVVAYPNPVAPEYRGPIRVDGLTFNAEVKILTTTGQLVASGTSNGGTYVWDGCDKRGRRVASGVYHVVSSTESGKKAVVARIIFIR